MWLMTEGIKREGSSVSVRRRSGEQLPAQPLTAFLENLMAEIASKAPD